MAYLCVYLMGLFSVYVCASKNRRETIITGSFYTKNWIEKERTRVASPAIQNERRRRSLSLFLLLYVPSCLLYLPLVKRKKGRERIYFSFLSLSLSLSLPLVVWSDERHEDDDGDDDKPDRDMQSVDCHYRSTDGQAEELYHLWIRMSAIPIECKMQ
jgi:hypothetical protein